MLSGTSKTSRLPRIGRKWDDLIYQFTKHLVDRYGMDEVAKWYFEVWNEPNIDFWAGDPKQATYLELYDHRRGRGKAGEPRLRVGGPATAQAAWADAFIQHASRIMFRLISFPPTCTETTAQKMCLAPNENIPRERMVCRAVKKVHDQIKASALPGLP